MKGLYGLLFLLFGFVANSQKLLKGVVLDAQQNTPISNVSVFLNTTSIGTTTNAQGNFSLTIPSGKYELIVSSIGYETYTQAITATDTTDFIAVRLKTKTEVLQTVVVGAYEKDGWKKWGKFFLESFIGTSAHARNCQIKNTDVIKFRYLKDSKELFAFASEPLIVENKGLGYTVRYQLETFQYDFKTGYLLYAGFPFFQPIKGTAARKKRWEKNRSEVYYGSNMHFMRALYRNKIAEEGFIMNALRKVPNIEKQRVKAAYASNSKMLQSGGRTTVTTINADTTDYYNKILQQPDHTDYLDTTSLTGDDVAYAVNNTTAGIDFKNYLLIIYNKVPPAEFRQQFLASGKAMMSQVTLINQKPVEVQANGSYFNPVDLLCTGYWAWSEKIAMMLPFDYVPPKR